MQLLVCGTDNTKFNKDCWYTILNHLLRMLSVLYFHPAHDKKLLGQVISTKEVSGLKNKLFINLKLNLPNLSLFIDLYQ